MNETADREGETAGRADAGLRPELSARVVLITAPDLEVARSLARELVSRGVIACANLVPGIESIYRWQGAVLETREVLLVAKTSAARLAELEVLLQELHPYEVPECVAIAPARVAPAYLAWLLAASAPEDARS